MKRERAVELVDALSAICDRVAMYGAEGITMDQRHPANVADWHVSANLDGLTGEQVKRAVEAATAGSTGVNRIEDGDLVVE